MCGIAGLLGGPPAQHQAAAAAMAAALAHRGPDGSGSWCAVGLEGTAVSLVHRRLAIQDLSSAGQQPMVSACGRWVLVFNGEIYNQRTLRSDLERQGHRFRSSSDTEVLLQLLVRYGLAALQRLRGMYAFCLWDNREQKALLARDPYGIKPLYLWQGPGGQLLFASEVRALLASGLVPRNLDPTALAGFLASGSVPEPLTLVAGIHSLPPGWLGQWQEGRWHTQPHWRPSYAPALPSTHRQEVENTRRALEDSVDVHQIADVPVGLFLSGGLDSSAILALAHARGNKLTTLSIGFEERNFDESDRASLIARHFGSKHVSIRLSATRAASLVPNFLAAVDQPSIDGFNTFCVSKLASEEGQKVVLSGLGGDELFAGYPSFQKIPELLALHSLLGLSRPLLSEWLSRSRHHKHQRLASFLRSPATTTRAHLCLRGLYSPPEIAKLFQAWELPTSSLSWLDEKIQLIETSLTAESLGSTDIADQVAWLESSTYMGQQLLRDSDNYSMAHGIELRLPFVDSELFRKVAGINSKSRLRVGKKMLLNSVPELQKAVPPHSKMGFTIPIGEWSTKRSSIFAELEHNTSILPMPHGINQRAWPRRWAMMVVREWLRNHLHM